MTHSYQVSGITCSGCVAKVKSLLEKAPNVTHAEVSLDGKVQLTMHQHVDTKVLEEVLSPHPKYHIQAIIDTILSTSLSTAKVSILEAPQTSWMETYKPILLIFGYIAGATLSVEYADGSWDSTRWMRHFMAGFFLVFSFFKLLNVQAFAESYRSYDLLARRWLGWGYVYPFVELSLGILYLGNILPFFTNATTFLVMGVSTIGVIESLRTKRKFQCACLGAVFNLPMSTITLIEDLLMVGMAGVALLMF